MAWDTLSKGGKEMLSGDKPWDEMSIALEKIVKAYEDRWDRKPYFMEVVYALKIVSTSIPAKYFSDPENVNIENVLAVWQ